MLVLNTEPPLSGSRLQNTSRRAARLTAPTQVRSQGRPNLLVLGRGKSAHGRRESIVHCHTICSRTRYLPTPSNPTDCFPAQILCHARKRNGWGGGEEDRREDTRTNKKMGRKGEDREGTRKQGPDDNNRACSEDHILSQSDDDDDIWQLPHTCGATVSTKCAVTLRSPQE